MKGKGVTIFWIALAVLIVGGFGVSAYMKTLPGEYDGLAQCLKEKGAVFYGAFWCPHCQAQKQMFGRSADLLPYVECSNSDGQSQTQICIDKQVQQYPTWEFTDGTRLTGEQEPRVLAEKTGCAMPQ